MISGRFQGSYGLLRHRAGAALPPLSPPRIRHARKSQQETNPSDWWRNSIQFLIQHQITDGRVVQAQVLIDAVRLAPGSAGLSGGFSAGQAGGFRFSVCRLAGLSGKRAGGVTLNLSLGGCRSRRESGGWSWSVGCGGGSLSENGSAGGRPGAGSDRESGSGLLRAALVLHLGPGRVTLAGNGHRIFSR